MNITDCPVAYLYNTGHKIAEVRFGNTSSAVPVVRFTYDPAYMRTTSEQDGFGTTTFVYNPVPPYQSPGANRLAAIKGPLGAIDYTYDELGQVISRTVGGVTQYTEFDSLNPTRSVSNPLGSFTYAYTADTTQLASLAYPNGQIPRFSYLDNLHDQRLGRHRDCFFEQSAWLK